MFCFWTPEFLLKNCEGGKKRHELIMRTLGILEKSPWKTLGTLGGALVLGFEALKISFRGFFDKVLGTMGLLQDRVMQPREEWVGGKVMQRKGFRAKAMKNNEKSWEERGRGKKMVDKSPLPWMFKVQLSNFNFTKGKIMSEKNFSGTESVNRILFGWEQVCLWE